MKVLITGAASGIGRSLAMALANPQNLLVLVDLNQAGLDELTLQLQASGTETKSFAGNLADSKFLTELCEYLKTAELDVLINNAGVAHELKNFTEVSDADFDLGIAVNVAAPFKLIKAVLPGMQARKSGQIFNIASRSNIYGYPRMAVYAATKAAVTSLGQTVAIENPELKSVVVLPGRTNTGMQLQLRGEQVASSSQSPDFVADIIAKAINSEIYIGNGDILLIDDGKWVILNELFRADLHRNVS